MNDNDPDWNIAATFAEAALSAARGAAWDLRRLNAACCAENEAYRAENARLREEIARLTAALAATEAAHEEAVFGDGYTPAIPSPRPLFDSEGIVWDGGHRRAEWGDRLNNDGKAL